MRLLLSGATVLAWQDDTFRPIQNGYLGIDGDTICYVGAERPADAYDCEKDMTGRILMPGLINCHCHAAMTLLRGLGSDLPLHEWLFDEMFPVEDRLTAEDIAAGNELAMMEMIASGVTSFSDMYFEQHTLIESNERIGMKVNLCQVLQCFDPSQKPEDNDRIRRSLALYEKYDGVQDGRVRVDFAVHAEYTTNDAHTRYYAEQLRPYRDRNVRVHLHLSETQAEVDECIGRHGITPPAWFEQMGILELPVAAAHCVALTDEDIEIIKRNGVSPIHNPSSNMKLGSGFSPVPRMLAEGINVALGTDGAASNNNLNMFEEMHLAAVLHNGYHRDAVMMKPAEVLRMATVNGARLQGRSDTGRLEVGCKADIVAVDTRDRAHMCPVLDPMALLVYSAQASDVCMTMVDGRILYEDGSFKTLDPKVVLENAHRAAERLYGGDR